MIHVYLKVRWFEASSSLLTCLYNSKEWAVFLYNYIYITRINLKYTFVVCDLILHENWMKKIDIIDIILKGRMMFDLNANKPYSA